MSIREVAIETDRPADVRDYISRYIKQSNLQIDGGEVQFEMSHKHNGAFDLQSFIQEVETVLDVEAEVTRDELN